MLNVPNKRLRVCASVALVDRELREHDLWQIPRLAVYDGSRALDPSPHNIVN